MGEGDRSGAAQVAPPRRGRARLRCVEGARHHDARRHLRHRRSARPSSRLTCPIPACRGRRRSPAGVPRRVSSRVGTYARGSPIPMSSAPGRTSSPTSRTASTRCGSRSASAGIPIDSLATILEPVFLDLAPVVLDAPARAGGSSTRHSPRSSPTATSRRLPAPASGSTRSARRSVAAVTSPSTLSVEVARIAAPLGIRAITVDATAVHDAGASDVQELAYSLAAGAQYLRIARRGRLHGRRGRRADRLPLRRDR